MTFAGLPAENQAVASSDLQEVDVADAFERAARTVDRGQQRAWDLPEDSGSTPTTEQVVTWLRRLLVEPWCLDTESVDAVCAQFDLLLAESGRPGRVEVLCHAVDHRRPTVYLAVCASRGGALQPPRVARIEATVGNGS
jgi:hypothetical protein